MYANINRSIALCLACLMAVFVVLGIASSGCHTDAAVIKTDVHEVWDCTAPSRVDLVNAVAPLAVHLLEAAVDRALGAPYPAVDYAPVLAALVGLKDDILPCVVAVATGSVLSRPTAQSFAGVAQSHDQLVRRAWDRLRVERFGAATFVGVVGL
jgi:hypothetical protein